MKSIRITPDTKLLNYTPMKTQSLFEQFAQTCRPKEPMMLFKFKPTSGNHTEDEMETVVAPSLGEAIRKRPDMMRWYLHTITK